MSMHEAIRTTLGRHGPAQLIPQPDRGPDAAAIPALVGREVTRESGHLHVERVPGGHLVLQTSPGRCLLVARGETELRGWGTLDGPAVRVYEDYAGLGLAEPLDEAERYGHVGDVPAAVWQQAVRWAARCAA